jgi:hypothetical protein
VPTNIVVDIKDKQINTNNIKRGKRGKEKGKKKEK